MPNNLIIPINHFTSRFAGRVSIILLGTIGGQAVAFAALPFISHFYSSEVVGKAAVILALTNILSMIVCLQYDQAVIVSKNEDLPYVLILSFLFSFSAMILLWIAFVLSKGEITVSIYNFELDINIDWKLPLLSFIYSILILLSNYHLRVNSLLKVSVGRGIYYGGSSIFQVLGGWLLGGSEHIFILLQILGALFAVFYLFPYQKFINWLKNTSISDTKIRLHKALVTYKNFPIYQMWAAVVNSFSAQLPVFFLTYAFSESWAGLYYMAFRILAAPTTLISQALGQVFYRDSAERERNRINQSKLVEKMAISLMQVSYLPLISLGIFSPLLINIFLKAEWSEVGKIIQLLLISLIVTIVVSPLSPLLNVKEKQAGALFYNVVLLALKFAGLLIGLLFNSPILAISLFSIGTAIGMLLFFNYLMRSIQAHTYKTVTKMIPTILKGSILIVFALIMKYMETPEIIYYGVLIILMVLLAAMEIYKFLKIAILKAI